MDTKIVLGEITSSAANFLGLLTFHRRDRHPRAQTEAIALFPAVRNSPNGIPGLPVVKNHGTAIDIADNDVDIAVVIKVGDGQAAAHTWFDQGRPACLPASQNFPLRLFRNRFLG